MELFLRRLYNTKDYTIGFIKIIDTELAFFTLEDPHRFKKVKDLTRISAGQYKVKFREEPTPLTMRYRQRYDWFNFHLEITNVPNFKNVYFHVGNYASDSSGCILLGLGADIEAAMVTKSTAGFKPFYQKIGGALDNEEAVKLTILDQ